MKLYHALYSLMALCLLLSNVVIADDVPPTIDGEWIIESFILAGKPVDQQQLDRLKKTPYKVVEKKMTVGDGGTLIKTPSGDRASNGAKITFDDSKSPGVVACEMLGYDGWHGIFRIEGNKLTICRCSADNPLPTWFQSSAENKWQIRTYVRTKPAE